MSAIAKSSSLTSRTSHHTPVTGTAATMITKTQQTQQTQPEAEPTQPHPKTEPPQSPSQSPIPSPTPAPWAADPYIPPPDLKARIKASYDAIGPAYNSWTIHNPSRRLPFLSRVLALLPPHLTAGPRPVRVLELGSGAGVPVTEHLLRDGRYHVVANDMSTSQVLLGRALCGGTGRVEWVEGDMMALEFEEGSFDLVLGFYSLIHVPRDEQTVLLGRIRRWLRPGGLMLVNFPAMDMDGVDMERWFGEEGWMFWSGWGAEVTLEKVVEAGLEVVSSEVSQDDVDAAFQWVIARAP